MQTLSKTAQKLRALDLRTGKIPASVQKAMREDKQILSLVNALYETITQNEGA